MNSQDLVDFLEVEYGINVSGCDRYHIADIISRLKELKRLMAEDSVEEAPQSFRSKAS